MNRDGPGASAPRRMGGIRSIRSQTTAQVAIACHPNAIVGTGSSVRPPRCGVWAPQAQWIYRTGPGASTSFCRVHVRRFALAARGSGELITKLQKYKYYEARWPRPALEGATAPMPNRRYTEHPLPNYSASRNYFPSKRQSRRRLPRTSLPRWLVRELCQAIAPHVPWAVYGGPLRNYSASSKCLPSKPHSRYRVLRTSSHSGF